MPWSASSGATQKASTIATPTSPAANAASAGTETRETLLFGDDVLKGRPAQYREDGVVQPGDEQVGARVGRDARADAADDERDRERQEEERQDQLARAARRGHRRQQRPDRADADVREQDAENPLRLQRREEDRERGQGDDLDQPEEDEDRGRLAEPDRAPVGGGEHEAFERAAVALRGPRAREPEQRREDERDPEQPLRRDLVGTGREREVEDDE